MPRSKTSAPTSPLTGKALLQKLKEIPRLSKSEKAKACGYYSTLKDGETRVLMGEFMEALLDAEGLSLQEKVDKRGREPSYRVKVHASGQIVINSSYTQMMGLNPGEEFEIRLGYKHIHLVKIDPA